MVTWRPATSGKDGHAKVDGDGAAGDEVVELGADRPLGTWLRAHPQAKVHFDVLFAGTDRYKTDEVAGDPRLRLDLVDRVAVAAVPKGLRITAWHPGGGAHTFVVDTGPTARSLPGDCGAITRQGPWPPQETFLRRARWRTATVVAWLGKSGLRSAMRRTSSCSARLPRSMCSLRRTQARCWTLI
ncbi:hypothetical protein ACH427_27405 [Streptomyces sp. NPDC020379]|uniref:hypothetical protein n=1 Tax=Streptomyces sp. NPDC020379 TaxID=3365071 RepID=UPI0037B9098F